MNNNTLTLEWFLYKTCIDNLEFIGDETALSKPITGINVLDNPDGIHWIKKNELVLSTGYIFKDDTNMQKRIIKELSGIQCTAFCIKVKRFFDQIPDLIIEEAAKYNLPLVAVPFYHSFADIMDVIFHQLAINNLSQQYFVLEETEKMYQLLFQNEGISKMLEQISNITGTTTMITTLTEIPLYQYIPATDSLLIPESDELKIHAIPSSQEDKTPFRTCTFQFNNTKAEFTLFMLPNRNNYLCIKTEKKAINNITVEIIQKILPIITMELENLQQRSHCQPSRDYYASFFNLLSDIQSKSEEEIQLICTTYGFCCEGRKVCITIETQAELFQQRPFKQFYMDIEHIIKNLVKQYFLCFHEQHILIFLFYPSSHTGLEAATHAAAIAGQLFSELHEYSRCIRIGISRSHLKIASIAAAYEESLQAIHLQTKLKLTNRVTSCLKQTPYFLLNKLSDEDIKKLCHDTIMLLVQYDKENNTELLHTLKAYYICRFNISKTAKSLFLHRNTLTARLSLIKEIMGLTLEDIEEVFTIYMGICAYELLDEVN